MLTLLLALACGSPDELTPAPEPPAPPAPAHLTAPAAEPGAAETTRRVYFVSPKDGETVTSPVKIVMGLEGMEVRPAGQLVENTGHHHVIIGPAGIPEGQVVPADEKHIHFGAGQTEAEVELPPGQHQLTLQFADGMHVSYGDGMSTTITITVAEE